MKTIIHDLKKEDLEKIVFSKDDFVLSSLEGTKNCIGCFSCWTKHPKKCCLKDEFDNIVELLSKSEELIIISKNRYGCYSADTKRLLERCIGYVLPYFTIRNNEIHHESRYKKKLKLTTYFYEKIEAEEKNNIEKLVMANAININASEYKVKYVSDIKELSKCIH